MKNTTTLTKKEMINVLFTRFNFKLYDCKSALNDYGPYSSILDTYIDECCMVVNIMCAFELITRDEASNYFNLLCHRKFNEIQSIEIKYA